MKQLVEDIVVSFYLESRDFNGIHSSDLIEGYPGSAIELNEDLVSLIGDNRVGLLFFDEALNPHIIRLGFTSAEDQIAKLRTAEGASYCCYPRSSLLSERVNAEEFRDTPYTLALAFGAPQLEYRSFDISILESYRNDPRYLYKCDDIHGTIYYDDDSLDEADRVLIQRFGFSYNDDDDMAVAMFLSTLSGLTPEHQVMWRAKETKEKYLLHPDFYRTQVIGEFVDHVGIFSALLAEIYLINRFSSVLGRDPLFREDFGQYQEKRPKQLGWLVRPTSKEFLDFVHTLDKILSENLNATFFNNEVPRTKEVQRRDGNVQVQPIGTLTQLDAWIRKSFVTDDWTSWNNAYKVLREVRNERQRPAHKIEENEFDHSYFKKQKDLVARCYVAVRTIRIILESHPLSRAAEIEIPRYLTEWKIRKF